MSIRILHLADLHVGASFPSMGDRSEERSRDFLSALLRAVEYAVSDPKPVDLVAIAGDLFDTHDPDEGLVYQVEAALEQLDRAGLPTLIVPGTHDAPSYRRSIYRRLRVPKSAHGERSRMPPRRNRPDQHSVFVVHAKAARSKRRAVTRSR